MSSEIKKSYKIEIQTTPVAKAAKSVVQMIADNTTGEPLKIKSIIKKEKGIAGHDIYIDDINPNNAYGFIKGIYNGETPLSKDETEELILNLNDDDGYAVKIERVEGNRLVGSLDILIREGAANKSSDAQTSSDVLAIVKQKISEGILTEEEWNKRLKIFKDNRVDDFLIKRIVSGYRTYNKPVHSPSCIYVDPEIETSKKRGEEGIVAEGLRHAVSRIGCICEGEKSVGKNVYLETVAWLMGMPMYLITFSRQMSPSSIYGEKTTDNSAAKELATKEAYECALAKARVEAGQGSIEDIEKAARLEIIKAQSSSVNIVIDQSELYDWLVDGGLLVFNEMNMAEANFFASFTNQLLDGTGFLFIPGRGEVRIHKDCVLFGTQNANYEGVEQQNEATMSRFNCLVFPQPRGIKKQLISAVTSALKRDGFEGTTLPDEYYTQCEKFYQQCRKAASGDDASITNACLNIRGFVRALTAVAESNGMAKLKKWVTLSVINSCPEDERGALGDILNLIVTK